MNKDFYSALSQNSLTVMKLIPKSDLHSHAGRGGTIAYIEQYVNAKITPPSEPFNSLDEMNKWLNDNVKCYCPGLTGYLKRIEAAFAQAKADNVTVLALSFSKSEIDFCGGIDGFIDTMNGLHNTFAPETRFLPDLALGYDLGEQERLDEILSAGWFKGIDICNYSGTYSISEMKDICRKSRDAGLILKAHIGEFGGSDEVMKYAEELELDQIQHGIAAAQSPQVMNWLAKHKIQLNVCPTSNIMLKNSESYKTHQIRKLFDYGVPVTINTDDLLIFNATVSQEYLNLYNSGLMSMDELNIIRETGLKN